jgi:hypothetical protein
VAGRHLLPSILIAAAGVWSGGRELTGPVTPEDILRHCSDWPPIAAAYSPKPEIIDRLRALSHEVRVEVYLGTWCSDSKAHVCEYFKVLELTDTPLIQTAYSAVPEDKAKREAFLRGKNILKIPTFIIFVDGVEKGRIIEVPSKSIEEDLLGIIEMQPPALAGAG